MIQHIKSFFIDLFNGGGKKKEEPMSLQLPKPIKYQLTLERFKMTEKSTIGRLTVLDAHWFVLEDPIRDAKIPGETAIPEGEFRIIPTWSNKRKAIVPMLTGVPNFTNIQIHIGNYPEDTRGCLLPGKSYGANAVYDSTQATREIFTRLCEEWSDLHETWIQIRAKK